MSQSLSQKRLEGKDIVGYCEFLCTLLEEAFCNDILSVPTESIAAGFTTKSTVGIMLVGMVIDNMVVGGEIPGPKSLPPSYHAPTPSVPDHELFLCLESDNQRRTGPAYNCQQLNQGDVILKVDDEEVCEGSYAKFSCQCKHRAPSLTNVWWICMCR
jgi:hypothetical protein